MFSTCASIELFGLANGSIGLYSSWKKPRTTNAMKGTAITMVNNFENIVLMVRMGEYYFINMKSDFFTSKPIAFTTAI